MFNWLINLFKPKPIDPEAQKFYEWLSANITVHREFDLFVYRGNIYDFEQVRRIYKMRAFS